MSVLRRSILAAFTVLLSAAGSLAAEPLRVVATTGMIADVTREIAGETAEVKALMGPGIDPHAYRQTRSDIVALANADLVLWNGLYLEAQMEDVLTDIARRTTVVAVAEAVGDEHLIAHDDYADRFDPHVWMDPRLWAVVVERIAEALVEVDPGNSEIYEANAATFIERLNATADYADGVLASVTPESRILITAHDAFNYFGRAYGFEVVGIQGISTESEAGLARVRELVDMLVDRQIGAVFVESSVSDRSVRALIEGAEARGHKVSIGGELFSDAMGQPGTYEGTYLGMIDHNVTTISRALGGTAPERGKDGLLAAGS